MREKDYSYILVYRGKRNFVTGVIKVKECAIQCLKHERVLQAGEVMKPNANMLTVYEDTNLLHMLLIFQAKKTRVALVCNQKRKNDPNIKSIMYSVRGLLGRKVRWWCRTGTWMSKLLEWCFSISFSVKWQNSKPESRGNLKPSYSMSTHNLLLPLKRWTA